MTERAGTTSIFRLRVLLWIASCFLLVIPAIAMHFTEEVRWDATDFLAAAGLIGVTGISLELLTRAIGSRAYKAGAATAVLAISALIWINAAVGIIGREGDRAGWVFVAVTAAVIGFAVYAFRPRPR